MERYTHIAECLRLLRITKTNEAVTICEGRVQNGSQLVDRVAALSTGLLKMGLQSGERVAIAALNSEWYLEWFLAVPSAGGIIAPLNHRWSVEEASEAIQEIEASILVVDGQCASWCSVLKSLCSSLVHIVYIGSGGCGDTKSLIHAESILQLAGSRPELQFLLSPHSIALICFTSGTTGRPKGVSISHNALLFQSLAKIEVMGYSKKDVYLHTTTLCHIGGISSALATVMANSCHIILPKFEPAAVFEAIQENKVSTMILVPAMLHDMISYMQNTRRETKGSNSLRSFPTMTKILNGAGSLHPSQIEAAKDIFPSSRIMSAYGMTEACSSLTFLLVHDPWCKSNNVQLIKEEVGTDMQDPKRRQTFHLGGVCVGKPAPHVEIRINSKSNLHMCTKSNITATKIVRADSELRLLEDRTFQMDKDSPGMIVSRDNSFPCGEQLTAGTVLTRGAHVMNGYWGQPMQSKVTLHADGWLETGDVGWIDELGQLWLLGRQKDVIKSGGENVYASEVEGVLARHPAVLAVAVVGVPDNRLGESVAAMVRIQQEWNWENRRTTRGQLTRVMTETLLRVHCQQQGLSRYKVPRFILMQEEPFPVTSTGKMKKDQVRSLLMARLEQISLAKESTLLLAEHSTSSTIGSRL